MQRLLISSLVAAALATTVLLGGCSGGGKSPLKPMIMGRAYINYQTRNPRIGILFQDTAGLWHTASSAVMPTVASGWGEVTWRVTLPPTGIVSSYAIGVFNDTNLNTTFSTNEFLGQSAKDGLKVFLRDDGNGGWSIGNSTVGTIYPDATACSGSDIYINCVNVKGTSNQIFTVPVGPHGQ